MNDDSTEGTAFKKGDLLICTDAGFQRGLKTGGIYRYQSADDMLDPIFDVEALDGTSASGFAWRFKALEGFPVGTRVRVVKEPFYMSFGRSHSSSVLSLGDEAEVTYPMDSDGDVALGYDAVNVACLEVVEPEPTIDAATVDAFADELADATELAEDEADMVNHPQHYLKHPSGVEIIDITRHHSFTIGNALKYVARHQHKGNPVRDLEKALWYLNKEVETRTAEEWATFPGDSRYEVSTQGNVRNAATGRLRKPVAIKNGYLTISTERSGVRALHYVHRMVAETFLGEIPEGWHVCHRNGDRTNNSLLNLRMDSPSGNAADRVRHDTHISGERAPWASLDNATANIIRGRANAGESRQDLAEEYGVGIGVVQRIAQGKTYLDPRGQAELDFERFIAAEEDPRMAEVMTLIWSTGHEHKGNPVQDLRKAIKYLEFAIEDAEKAESGVAA